MVSDMLRNKVWIRGDNSQPEVLELGLGPGGNVGKTTGQRDLDFRADGGLEGEAGAFTGDGTLVAFFCYCFIQVEHGDGQDAGSDERGVVDEDGWRLGGDEVCGVKKRRRESELLGKYTQLCSKIQIVTPIA